MQRRPVRCRAVQRPIVGFHQDDADDWVAELSCGHRQHVRHRPPFVERPWVMEAAGRRSRLGTSLPCPLCDRCEVPPDFTVTRRSPLWDETTAPATLRRQHRLPAGTWGRLTVYEGRLRLLTTVPTFRAVLTAGDERGIPPEVPHAVTPLGHVRFGLEFLIGPQRAPRGFVRSDEGGDPVCWIGQVCPECGAFTGDGYHRPGCPVVSLREGGRPERSP